MNSEELYIEAVAHWDDIWRAFKDDNVDTYEDAVFYLKSGGLINTSRWGCVYCYKFHDIDDCEGCPISEASGYSYCKGTPYRNFKRNPCSATALTEREFVRKNPPAGVKVMEIEDIRKQRSNHDK